MITYCEICSRARGIGQGYYYVSFMDSGETIHRVVMTCKECSEKLRIHFEEFINELNEVEGKILEDAEAAEDIDNLVRDSVRVNLMGGDS